MAKNIKIIEKMDKWNFGNQNFASIAHINKQ